MSSILDSIQSSGGGGIVSSAINGITSALSSKRQYKRQKNLMKMQQRYQSSERKDVEALNERRWREQLAYDSPSAVMQRLKNAGVHPDLAFAGGNVSGMLGTGTPPEAAVQSAPAIATPASVQGSLQAASAFGDMFSKAAQIRNLEADTDKKKTEGDVNKSITLLNGAKLSLTKVQESWTKEDINRIQSDINLNEETAAKLRAEVSKISADTKISKQQLKEAKESFRDRMDFYAYNNRKVLADAGITEHTIGRYNEYMDTLLEQIASSTYLSDAQGRSASIQANIDSLMSEAMRSVKFTDAKGNEMSIYKLMAEMTAATLSGNNNLLQKNLELLEKYGDAQAVMGIVGQSLGAVLQSVSAYMFMKGAGKSNVPSSPTFKDMHPILY